MQRRGTPQFELVCQTTFGAEGRRASKSLSLGTVKLGRKSQLHHLVALRDFNPETHISSLGVKLFVEQYIQLMQSNEFLIQCFECVTREQRAVMKLYLGERVGVVLDTEKSRHLHLALFRDAELSEETEACVTITREEWDGLMVASQDFVMKLSGLKDKFTATPPDNARRERYHRC